MNANLPRSGAAPVPAELVRDLGAAICQRLWRGEGGALARAAEIGALLDGCDDAGRRSELEGFVCRVDELPPAAWRDFAIAMHPVQVRSKLWLIDELSARRDLARSTLVVLGAWYGVLPLLVNWRVSVPPDRMLCVDLDPAACELGARTIGSSYANLEYRCADMLELDPSQLHDDASAVVINTSCEHVAGLGDWWARVPAQQLAVLQSNNYRACADHVNCAQSLDEFKRQMPMSELLYEGVAHLTDEGVLRRPDLDRFMLIGSR